MWRSIVEVIHRRPAAFQPLQLALLVGTAGALNDDKECQQQGYEREVEPAPLPLDEQRRQEEVVQKEGSEKQRIVSPYMKDVGPLEGHAAILVDTDVVAHDGCYEQQAPHQSIDQQLLSVVPRLLHRFDNLSKLHRKGGGRTTARAPSLPCRPAARSSRHALSGGRRCGGR